NGRTVMLGVTGCVAQAEGAEIIRRQAAVDVVVGPQSYQHLPELLAQARAGSVVATEFEVMEKFAALDGLGSAAQARSIVSRRQRQGPPRVAAFLTVQEGCDKFCTSCVVPYTRGAEVSRGVGQIVAEASRLAGAGVREITLLGQNVNAWHGEGPD